MLESGNKFIRWAFVLMLLLSLSPAATWAGDDGYVVISTERLKGMISTGPRDFLVIDARNPGEYEEVHIPGAINIPQKQFDRYAKLLPGDRSVGLVFYCNGVKCGKSKRAAKAAQKIGYTNVMVYADGMPVWEEGGLPIYKGPAYEAKIQTTIIAPKDLSDMMRKQSNEVIVVDVRDTEEFSEGHIPGALNIPVAEFASRSGDLDKNKTVVVYCNSGGRSYQAYRKLMKLSYKNIRQATFADWKEAGLSVEHGS